MKIKKAMILCAGLGTRMESLTTKIPKPLLRIGNSSLLEKAINFLINYEIEELVINTHYLAAQIENFVMSKKYNIKIILSNERKELLDTGGGILFGTKDFKKDPFIVLNPDTLWSSKYVNELRLLEKMYFDTKKTSLLLVDKNMSHDKSFTGDFQLNEKNYVSRDEKNKYIYTGLQILDRSIFINQKKEKFSMNEIWNNLIISKNLVGLKSNQKFYHLNTKTVYNELIKLKLTD